MKNMLILINYKIYLKYELNLMKKFINIFQKLKKVKFLIGETIIDEYIYSNVLGKAGKDPILTINLIIKLFIWVNIIYG